LIFIIEACFVLMAWSGIHAAAILFVIASIASLMMLLFDCAMFSDSLVLSTDRVEWAER